MREAEKEEEKREKKRKKRPQEGKGAGFTCFELCDTL